MMESVAKMKLYKGGSRVTIYQGELFVFTSERSKCRICNGPLSYTVAACFPVGRNLWCWINGKKESQSTKNSMATNAVQNCDITGHK